MSRLGKKSLQIPEKVKVELKDGSIKITGPLGNLTETLHSCLSMKSENNQVQLEMKTKTKESNIFLGLTRGLLKNAIEGVTKGFKKDLEVLGLGYKAILEGKILTLNVGFSHQVKYNIPEGIKIIVEKMNLLTVTGIDKALVGEVAASIRAVRPPEPYKGTGIRYAGEHIIRKEGKTAAGGSGGK